jgi:hypothetical protein
MTEEMERTSEIVCIGEIGIALHGVWEGIFGVLGLQIAYMFTHGRGGVSWISLHWRFYIFFIW